MKTLILDNYDSFTYNLFQYIAELGGNPEVFYNNKITLHDIEKAKYTHIIISPGPGSPENKKDFGICGEVIQKISGKIPLLGVCLGHQGIIYSLGGRVVRAPEPMHGKTSLIKQQATENRQQRSKAINIFSGLPEKIQVMRYHSLIGERETLPRELIITAQTDDGIIMAVQHKNYPLYGIQFHPESIETPHGKDILRNFLAVKPL